MNDHLLQKTTIMNGRSFSDGLFTKGLGWRRGYSRSLPMFIPWTCDWPLFFLFLPIFSFLLKLLLSLSFSPLSPRSLSCLNDCWGGSVEDYNSTPEKLGSEWRTRDSIIYAKYSVADPIFIYHWLITSFVYCFLLLEATFFFLSVSHPFTSRVDGDRASIREGVVDGLKLGW